MATDRISALKSFVHAVEFGSLSAAAKHLKISQPAVSHHLRTLESELGTRLLNRSTRHLTLTEAGARYHAYAVDILEKIAEADRSVRSLDDQMTGRLAIGAPVGFAETVLGDFIIGFQKKYPALLLDISLSDQFIDVLAEGLDVSIRMGAINDDRLIVRKLGIAPRHLAASPAYLDEMGRPKHPDELGRHRYLLYANFPTGQNVTLCNSSGEQVCTRINPVLRVNNSGLIRHAAVNDMGIGLAQRWLLDPLVAEGKLEYVLPDWHYEPHPIHAVYPSNRYIPSKVQRFVEELKQFLDDRKAFG